MIWQRLWTPLWYNDGWLHSSQKEDHTTVFILHQGQPPYPACTGTNVPSNRNQSANGKTGSLFCSICPQFWWLMLWTSICLPTFLWLTISFSFVSWSLWIAPDFSRSRGSKQLTPGCVGSLLESGFGLGTFLSSEMQVLSFSETYSKNCLFSHSWLQIFLHFKAPLYSPEHFIWQCAIVTTFNWIIHYDDMPVHIYHTDKFITASLPHSSFNSPLKHWVIWRTNIPRVCEREKGERVCRNSYRHTSQNTLLNILSPQDNGETSTVCGLLFSQTQD